MKKFFVILAVLMWTVPALAVEGESVDFSASYDAGTHQLTISYQVMDTTVNPAVPKTDGTNPIGIALRLNVDAVASSGDVTSSGASGYTVVSAVNGSNFLVNLDTAWHEETNGDGYTLYEGGPLAKWIDTPGVDKGLPDLPASKVAICVGHLRDSVVDTEYAGPASDDIAVVQLSAPSYDDSVAIIDVDSDRGGVVGSPLITNLPIEVAITEAEPPCFFEGKVDSSGHVVTAAEVARWATLPPAAQACWCYACFGSGDANGDCVTATGDLYKLVNVATSSFFPWAGNECADINYDGVLATGDLYKMVNVATSSFFVCPTQNPPCVPQ